MSKLSYQELTANNLMFRMLNQEAREHVIRLAKQRSYQDGELIIQQGAPDQDVYLLRKGKVDVQVSQEGFEVELNTLEPGTIFGELAEVAHVPRTASVLAIGEVEVLCFPGPELVEELRRHPTASKLLDHIVKRRVIDTTEKTFN